MGDDILHDLFNPRTGGFAKNIRSTADDDTTELRELMKQFGWIAEFPALVDENDVTLVGHRRLKIAKQLNIEPVIRKLTLGEGDKADAKRLRLAIASNIGFKPMTSDDRKHIAEHLYGVREWTMQRIAEALDVSQQQISKDLSGLQLSSKPSRPKGGRPKGSDGARRNASRRKNSETNEQAAASLVLDKGKSYEAAALETGVGSVQIIKTAVAREEGRRQALTEPKVDSAGLSLTAQQKLDAAIRQHKRKLDLDFLQRVLDEVRARIEATVLPSYTKTYEECQRVIKARKGVMDRSTYKKILSCLHPDRVQDAALKRRYEEAFNLFSKLETSLLAEKDSQTPTLQWPTTYEGMMAMRQKATENRKAKRAMRVR